MKTTFRRLGAAARALCLLAGFIAASQTANAACTGPAGNAGDQRFATNYGVMAFCDGTNWISMAGGVSVTVNTSGGGATPAGASADVQFNSSGALAADTGNFTYSSGLLKAPNISTTAVTASGLATFGSALINGGITATGVASLTTVSASAISATYIQIPSATNVLACGSGMAGTMRYTSGTMQVCDGSGWTNVGIGIPQGTITAFALTSCPNGWSEYIPARGRFLRGIDNGAGVDPDGTRLPGSMQTDALQDHRHGVASSDAYVSGYGAMAGSGPQSADSTFSRESGHVDNARTSSETRPVNVAVTFCRYDGFQSQLQTGVATLSSLTDVSVAGATTGQVLTYSGGTWVASSTTGGAALGDRITSGTVSIIANQSGGYTSLTTNGTTWGYLGSSHSYIPTLETVWEQNGTISTSMIQFGSNSATCDAGMAGSVKYSATSDTIQVCTSGGWTSVASSSIPNTTISAGTNNYGAIFSGPNTLVTDSALYVDRTSHRVGIGTTAPMATLDISATLDPGLRITGIGNTRPLQISCSGYCYSEQYNSAGPANGKFFRTSVRNEGWMLQRIDDSYSTAFNAITVSGTSGNIGISNTLPKATLDVGGTISASDAIQVGSSSLTCGSAIAGAIRYNSTSNTIQVCASNVWTSLASGTTAGGGGTPAGSTGDIQFNTSGSFDADTGKFVWDKTNDRLGIGTNAPSDRLTVGASSSANDEIVHVVSAKDAAVVLEADADNVSENDNAYLKLSQDAGAVTGILGFAGGANTDPEEVSFTGGFDNALVLANRYSLGSLQLGTNGVPQVTIRETGSVGIGTVAPNTPLEVSGSIRSSINTGSIYMATTLTNNQVYSWNSPLYLNYSSTSNTIINNNGGNVGIGTNAPSSTLTISGSTWSSGEYQTVSANALRAVGGNYGFILRNDGSATYFLLTASGDPYGIWSTLRPLTIVDATGAVSIGTSLTTKDIDANGTLDMNSNAIAMTGGTVIDAGGGWHRSYGNTGWYNGTYGGGWYMTDTTYIRNYGSKQVYLNANIYAPAFLYTSDRRLKTDITPLTGGLAKLDSINPVSFRFISDTTVSGTTPHPLHVGVIAQDVRKVYPQAVHADAKGMLSVDYPALVGPIFDMLKELKAIVFADHGALDEAKAEIKLLKAANDNLIRQNRTLKAANDNAQARLEDIEGKLRAHGW